MLKDEICGYIDEIKSFLFEVSKEIHENPELNFKEYKPVLSVDTNF